MMDTLTVQPYVLCIECHYYLFNGKRWSIEGWKEKVMSNEKDRLMKTWKSSKVQIRSKKVMGLKVQEGLGCDWTFENDLKISTGCVM